MNWTTVAPPKLCPAKLILPGVWTSIRFLKGWREVEEVFKFSSFSPRSSFRMLS